MKIKNLDGKPNCSITLTLNNVPTNNTAYFHCESGSTLFNLEYSYSGGFPDNSSSYSFQVRVYLNGNIIAYNPNQVPHWENGFVTFSGYGNYDVGGPGIKILRVELESEGCNSADEKTYSQWCYIPATPFTFIDYSNTIHPSIKFWALDDYQWGPILGYEIYRTTNNGTNWNLLTSINPFPQGDYYYYTDNYFNIIDPSFSTFRI